MSYSFDNLVTKDFLLSRLREEEIFERYLGVTPRLGERYVNTLPGRPKIDRRPGCKFYENGSKLIFKDFAWQSFDAFEVAKQYYGVDFYTALNLIAQDFNLVDKTNTPVPVQYDVQLQPNGKRGEPRTGYTPIQVRLSKWKDRDFDYWSTFDMEVTKSDLDKYRVYPIDSYWMDGWLSGTKLTGTYGFLLGFPDKWQVYRPFSKNKAYKFRQSTSSGVFGLDDLDYRGTVILTKSVTDRIYLRLLGYNAVNVLSETAWLSEGEIQQLESYGKVIMLFDNDDPGRAAVKERSEAYQWDYIEYPTSLGKDTKEICKNHGTQVVRDYLDEVLDDCRL